MKPNAAKLVSDKIRKLGDERIAAILEKVKDEELSWWVEQIFAEKKNDVVEHQRNKRSALISAALTAHQASCRIYSIATGRNVTVEKVIKVIREVAPEWMQKRSHEEILTKGLRGLSKLMRVVCHVSGIKEKLARYVIRRIRDESLDFLDRLVNETSQENSGRDVVTYIHVNDKSWTRNPAYFMLRTMLTDDTVDMHDLTIFIRKNWSEKDANWMIETLMRDGKTGLLDVSIVACEIIKASSRSLILNNEESLSPQSLTIQGMVTKFAFCALWRMAGEKGVTRDAVVSFIQSKFPEKWRKKLLGQLAMKGMFGVVETARAMCGVRKNILVHSATVSPIASLSEGDKMMKEFTMWARDAISTGLQAAQPKIDNLKKTIVDAARQTQG